MKRKTSLTRGEKRWVGEQADGYVSSFKVVLDSETAQKLQLPEKTRWDFSKDETSGTHNLYQAVYRVGQVYICFWITADPRRSFDSHSHGFRIEWNHQVLYECVVG